MSQNYTPEFKKKIVRLHKEEGENYKSITAEYGISKASISKVVNLPKGRQRIQQRMSDRPTSKRRL